MKFFFPDSQDQVDPGFDFRAETYASARVRHHDDVYAHEILDPVPFDGLLVSKAVVDGLSKTAGRYTLAQRHRMFRTGVHAFFRLDRAPGPPLQAMGDCGAFTYKDDDVQPYSIDEVIEFYDQCRFDYGISVDHLILDYRDAASDGADVPDEWRRRQSLTLDLADRFLQEYRRQGCRFVPLGVAQGWSPASMASSVRQLQDIGYERVALGGMVPLRTREIIACLQAIHAVRRPSTQLHLLGVTRCDHVTEFEAYGVTSFDSTSAFRQAFMDKWDNYHVLDGCYTAIRVPQVDGNARLKRAILAGQVDQAKALSLERRCIALLESLDDISPAPVPEILSALGEYAELCGVPFGHRQADAYRQTLEDAPWRHCPCAICRRLGIHAVIFRGSERNKSRGFHNLSVFRRRLDRHQGGVVRCTA